MGIFDFFKRAAPSRPLPSRGARGAFIAAAQDRFTASWLATARDINEELRGDLDRLIARSREMARNNDYAKRFLTLVAQNVVGPRGFILQSRVEERPGIPDSLANSAIEGAFARWSRRGSAEITGTMSFVDLCRAVVTAVARDGGALVRIVRGSEANNPERLAYQHVDIARLATQHNQAAAAGRNAIVMGIEIDTWGRVVAYWIKPQINSGQAERVPASDMLHIYLPEMPEQVRGIPWMHAAMLAMHDLGEFNRSALLAARRGADTLGFIVSPDGSGEGMSDATESDTAEPLKISAPGIYDVLPEGYDIRTPEYNYPNQVYDGFVNEILRRIASGLSVSAHNLTGNMTQVNYSSARIAELAERDRWMMLQEWFVGLFLEPVFDEWFARALTAGALVMPNGSALPAAKAEKFRAHEWQGRRWQWVDPEKDINAARLAVKSGIASPQMIAAQNGVDVEDVINSTAAFEAMVAAKKVGLIDYEVSQPAPAAPPAPDPALEKLAKAAMMRMAEPPAVPPAPTFTVAPVIHTPDVRVENHLPASVVEVTAPDVRVDVAAPSVTVEPPDVEVRVDAIMPEQAAPVVEVNVEMPDELKMAVTNMPDRKTTTTIERNASGEIIKSSQLEQDA